MIGIWLALMVSCGSREKPVDAGIRDGVLHFNNGTEPADIDPQTVTGQPEHRIIMALIEGLVDYSPIDGSPVPAVAERWDISTDGKTYTFHLRPDAKWSNGDPVTAHDFINSWKRMLTPSLAADYAYMLFYVEGAEDFYMGRLDDFSKVGFSAIDDHTLMIHLQERTPFFLGVLVHQSWFPVHLPTVEKFGGLDRKGSAWTRPDNFVGNGAFVLKEWIPNQRLVVAKSPTYWDHDAVSLNEIAFYPVENQDAGERMFRAGQLHIATSVPLGRIEAYRRDNPEVLHINPFFGTMYMRANVNSGPLTNPQVRQALGLAIDRELLTTQVLRGGKIPAHALTPPTDLFDPPRGFSFDPDRARELLAEAGFPEGKGFNSISVLYPTSENGQLISEAIQEMWRVELGINVQLVNQEWKVYLDSMNSLDYDLAISIWVGDYADPHSFLDMHVTDGGNNRTGFSNAEYDRLVSQALRAANEKTRMAIYARLEEILATEVPAVPICYYASVELVHPAVRGWNPNILDQHPWKYVSLDNAASTTKE